MSTHREGRRQRKAAKFLRDQFQLSVVPLTLSLLTLKLSDQIFPEKLQDFTFLAKGKFLYWAQRSRSQVVLYYNIVVMTLEKLRHRPPILHVLIFRHCRLSWRLHLLLFYLKNQEDWNCCTQSMTSI